MTHHKKVYRVLVYLAILGAVGTGATYAKYVSQVGSARESAKVAGFNVTAKLETTGDKNMTENVATDTGDNTGRFKFEIKNTEATQEMTVTFTNNSKVWVKPAMSGGATARVTELEPFTVIKQGETGSYTFNISSTYGLADKNLIFTATQVME
ncbi:hypothetical protein [Pseudolactococcus reticulitermitis]|uniref:Uncharacterized protein n=1 Tax=Pseudolactococcus reticulitermitis TaxID=2025039 RepID=A0A224X2H2_9LACT|nr:hypothetical protein [Lactococcus reticulitermitis]GAX48338.1 hypothetical protein RsY01_1959 [Lactococcus reticulitermitis]